MSFTVHLTNGDVLADIPDQVIVKTECSLNLTGRGAIKYAQAHSENFVHLLENFAHVSSPSLPLIGQQWFDISTQQMKVWNGTSWVPTGGGGVGLTATIAQGSRVAGFTGVVLNLISGSKATVGVMLSEGSIIAVVSSAAIGNGNLPPTVLIDGRTYTFAAYYPNGIQNGLTLTSVGSNPWGYYPNASTSSGTITDGGGITRLTMIGQNGVVVSGSPLNRSGTLGVALANTAVVPGTYSNPSLTVDGTGRITQISNSSAIGQIPGASPVTSIGTISATGNLQVWVRTDGDDGNLGNSNAAGQAFRTVSAALLAALQQNRRGQQIQILLGIPGIYDAPVLSSNDPLAIEPILVGAGSVLIQGDITQQDSYALAGVGAVGTTGVVHSGWGSFLHLRGVSVLNYNPNGVNTLTATSGAEILCDYVTLGGAEGTDGTKATSHIFSTDNAQVRLRTGCKIASSMPYGLQAYAGGITLAGDLSLIGTRTFVQAFCLCATAGTVVVVNNSGVTITGTGVGRRYIVTSNGVIQTQGRAKTFFPGGIDGIETTNGIYV